MAFDQAVYLLILYSAIALLNVVVSLWFWRGSRLSIYASLTRMWVGMCMVLVLSTITQGHLLLIPLVGMIPGCYVAGSGACEVLLRFIGKTPSYKVLRIMTIVSAIVCVVLYYAKLPFVIYAIPAGFMNMGPLAYGLIRLMREKRESLTPAKTGFALTCAAMVIHSVNIPFWADRPEMAVLGFSIGILIVQGLAIFGPLVVLEVANVEADQLRLERGKIKQELKEAGLMLELVADTASLLPLSLDYRGVVEQTVRLGVTHFGGICTLHVVDDGVESMRLAAISHATSHGDPEAGRKFESQCRVPSTVPSAVKSVLQTGEAVLGAGLASESEFLSSYVSAPLRDRGHISGALSLFSAGAPHTDRDLRLVVELAGRASSALQSAKLFQDVQHAVSLRDDFLAVASHELKTPLTSLNLQIETLRTLVNHDKLLTFPQDQLRRMLRMSADQLKSLAKLIDGLLDVSRITEQGIVLGPKVEVDLAELVRDVTGRFELQLQATRCPVELLAEPDVIGRWDRVRVDQIVTHLLINAMKYGAGKPIRIQVKGADHLAHLIVQDFGMGIAPQDHERIFGRFERAVPVQRFGGLGLGLYIAREIARAHGGVIRVESEPGIQTRFIVELPLGCAEATQA